MKVVVKVGHRMVQTAKGEEPSKCEMVVCSEAMMGHREMRKSASQTVKQAACPPGGCVTPSVWARLLPTTGSLVVVDCYFPGEADRTVLARAAMDATSAESVAFVSALDAARCTLQEGKAVVVVYAGTEHTAVQPFGADGQALTPPVYLREGSRHLDEEMARALHEHIGRLWELIGTRPALDAFMARLRTSLLVGPRGVPSDISVALGDDSMYEFSNAPLVAACLEQIDAIAKLVFDSVAACDASVQNSLFESVVVTGGNALMCGFGPALADALNAMIKERLPGDLRASVTLHPLERTAAFVGAARAALADAPYTRADHDAYQAQLRAAAEKQKKERDERRRSLLLEAQSKPTTTNPVTLRKSLPGPSSSFVPRAANTTSPKDLDPSQWRKSLRKAIPEQ